MKDLIDNDDTEIEDASAEADIRDGSHHQGDEYQLLVVPIDGRPEEAGWLRDKAVTLRLADGDSMVRVALDGSQARQLRDALTDIVGEPVDVDVE